MDLFNPCEGLGSIPLFQQFLGEGSGSNPADGFTGTGSSSTHPITESIFGFVGIIRVAWPIEVFQVFIGLWAGVLVFNHDRNCGSGSFSLEDPGKNPCRIAFLALCGDFTLAWTTTVQFILNFRFTDFQSGRATINHYSNSAAMGFSPSCDAEKVSETVAHQECFMRSGHKGYGLFWRRTEVREIGDF